MPDTLPALDRTNVNGLSPVETHNAVLKAYTDAMELWADLFGPYRRFHRPTDQPPNEPPVHAGRRRILQRHAPVVLNISPTVTIVYCARCAGHEGARTAPWPCADFVDAAEKLVDGLTSAEPGANP